VPSRFDASNARHQHVDQQQRGLTPPATD
jgi:hypothetical protein